MNITGTRTRETYGKYRTTLTLIWTDGISIIKIFVDFGFRIKPNEEDGNR